MAIKAHVSFPLRGSSDVGESIAEHFAKLGYRLDDTAPGKWVFRRGSKLASLWRFDIRSYDTTLHIRSTPDSDGGTRISCDWEVWTFATPTRETDVASLEGEGRQLKSLLRQRGEPSA